ncbi:MAG TPA: beta-propeller fold lactonase family protein [Clostridia bacterium]|nr:beta-propeller fold lactonase family protein [Clostridia bacterium]
MFTLLLLVFLTACGDNSNSTNQPTGNTPTPAPIPSPAPVPNPTPVPTPTPAPVLPARFIYTREPSNQIDIGAIQAGGRLTSGSKPILLGDVVFVISLVALPSGKFLYGSGISSSSFGEPFGKNQIGEFRIESTGGLTQLPGSPIDLPMGAGVLLVDPGGRFLFMRLDRIWDTWSVDANTGQLTEVGTSGTAGTGFQPAISHDGKFLFNIDTSNVENKQVVVDAVDTNGTATPVAGSPFSTDSANTPSAVAVSPLGNFVFVTNFHDTGPIVSPPTNGDISVFSLARDGSLTPVPGSPFPAGLNPGGPVITPDGKFLYIRASQADGADEIEGFSIASSGALAPLANNPQATGFIEAGIAMDRSDWRFSVRRQRQRHEEL